MRTAVALAAVCRRRIRVFNLRAAAFPARADGLVAHRTLPSP
ncbi:MAG: hypothetical protein K6T56_00975 [Burkholderiales bacterium]|nr:hypothetical protein [Burkholderiales bacterium]